MKLKSAALSLAFCFISSVLSHGKDIEIKLTEAPAPVQKSLKKYAGSNKVLKVEKALENNETQYEILTAKGDGKEIEYIFKTDGSLDATEEVLTMDELPPDVKATAVATAGKGKIKGIEKFTEDGKITYEVGYKSAQGEKMEAVISSKGKLLKNSEDND